MRLFKVTFAAFLTSAAAQFAFDVENTNKEAIYNDIEALWDNWAAIGNQVLESAREKYPDAYNQLTSIYGTTSLPSDFDARAAQNAADILARNTATTVWDQNAGDHAQYTFSVKDVEVGVETTADAATSEPTEAVESSSTDTEESSKESSEESSEESSQESSEESSQESSEELSGLESESSHESSSESSLQSEILDSETTSGASNVVLPALFVAVIATMHIVI
ncbi:hypothetical protein EV183_003706 [Coemansia sp. RSA 2336]|nr:hypothetical protein EV183_003706 [Coemansia sp. RSA 2336]